MFFKIWFYNYEIYLFKSLKELISVLFFMLNTTDCPYNKKSTNISYKLRIYVYAALPNWIC